MKKMQYSLLFAVILFIAACNSSDKKGSESSANDSSPRTGDTTTTTAPRMEDTSTTMKPVPPESNDGDTVCTITVSDTKPKLVRGKLGMNGPSVVYNFTIDKPQSITARIVPDKTDCNIRFSQIIMPGNESDGPFTRELKYKLPAKGKYQLIVGHNMMSGDPEICTYTLQVKLE